MLFFLRQNEDGEDQAKKGGNLKHRIMQYNEEKDEFEFVDNSFYDPSKIRKQEQVIILPDGSYIDIFNEEQGGLNQLPNFMLYSDAQNMDRAKLMDKVNTVKDTASFIGKIAAGKPFKDDVGFLDAAKEYAKATGRTFRWSKSRTRSVSCWLSFSYAFRKIRWCRSYRYIY